MKNPVQEMQRLQDVDTLRALARRFADPADYYDDDGAGGVHVEGWEATRLAEVFDRAALAMESTS